jgi:hypothetical protein
MEMQRAVTAPELPEVSTIWCDVERVPVVTGDESGAHRQDTRRGTRCLRVPPTDEAASPNRVAAMLRAATVDPHA